jgi:hypothetical protein
MLSTVPTPCRDSVPKFGPVVEIVTVTGVAPVVPAAIDAGLNSQLAPGPPVINGGNPEHAKLTAELNDAPPAGAAENV